jgi:FkbM family methyltransferase
MQSEHLRFRDQFTFASRCKFLGWWLLTLVRKDCRVSLNLLSGGRFFLCNRDDYGVAYEIFIDRIYNIPPVPARLIVDLGGHSGFTALFFAWHYPEAQIVVFEPDARRAEQSRKHVAANRLQERVRVFQAAASVRDGQLRLSRQGASSRLGNEGDPVDVVDIFRVIGADQVDIFKMDIEGGEYAILQDERLARLMPGVMALEWHNTADCSDGRSWCSRRLLELGYRITAESGQTSWSGNLVATRR